MADPYRSNGSAAYDVRRRNTAQPLERPERLPDAPARRKPARHVRARLGISPLTALGAAAAVLMLALVVFSYIRLYEARSDVGKLQTQLSTLEEQQARLQSQYDNALDLEQIEKRAKELGMRPAGQLADHLCAGRCGRYDGGLCRACGEECVRPRDRRIPQRLYGRHQLLLLSLPQNFGRDGHFRHGPAARFISYTEHGR